MRAITIKTDGAYEVVNIPKGLEALRKAVGGDIEGHTFSGHTDFIVFINEIGKLVNLPPNSQAILFCLEFESTVDIICGDVIICGMDPGGNTCDLTDEQIDRFLQILYLVSRC